MSMGSEDPQEVFEREVRSSDTHLKAALAFAIVMLLVLLATVVYLLTGNVEEERQEKVQAQVEAEELRDRVLRVCASPGESRKVLTEIGACQRAKQAEKSEPDPEVVIGKACHDALRLQPDEQEDAAGERERRRRILH